MGIHYNKIHEHPYLLWQWVLCVSMYITRNRTIDWRSGVNNDTIWALICASVIMWTHLLYGICTAFLFSIWMHRHDLRMRTDIVGSYFGIAEAWNWKKMNDRLLITLLWCWMVIVCTLLYSWLYGVYWILIIFYCSILSTGIESFHNMEYVNHLWCCIASTPFLYILIYHHTPHTKVISMKYAKFTWNDSQYCAKQHRWHHSS